MEFDYYTTTTSMLTLLESHADELEFKYSVARFSAVKIWGSVVSHALGDSGKSAVAKYLLELYFGASLLPQYFTTHNTNLPDVFANLIKSDEKSKEHCRRIAKHILNIFLIPMKNKGRPGAFTSKKEDGEYSFQTREEFRKEVMNRDHKCCQVTGRYDRTHSDANNNFPVRLEAAHIVPNSVAQKGVTLGFIELFTGGEIKGPDLAADINGVDNGILLQIDAHRDFDDYLWGIQITRNNNTTRYTAVQIDHRPPGLSFQIRPEALQDLVVGKNNYSPYKLYCNLHMAVGQILLDINSSSAIDYLLDTEAPMEDA